MIFETERLRIRKATPSEEDVEMYYALWNHPKVMSNVGYPRGLGITKDELKDLLTNKQGSTEYNCRLVVELKKNEQKIGECKLGYPDSELVSEPDVKLFPEFWGNGFGKEIMQGLVDYLFTHTSCKAVKTTPNVLNVAAQKMYESVGGRIVGEDTYHWKDKDGNPLELKYYIYMVFKEVWERKGVITK